MSTDPLADALGITPRSLQQRYADESANQQQENLAADQRRREQSKIFRDEQSKAPTPDQRFEQYKLQRQEDIQKIVDNNQRIKDNNTRFRQEEEARVQQQRRGNGSNFEQPKPSSIDKRPPSPASTPTVPQPKQPVTPSNAQPKPASLPTSTVALAEPPSPIKPPFPGLSRPPTSLPQPMRFPPSVAGPAIFAPVDFGMRLFTGQPPGQAAAGTAGGLAGGVAGAAIGSLAGPVGTFAGGLVGGYVGGAIGDKLYNLVAPPREKPYGVPQSPLITPPPFNGGQSPGVIYRVAFQTDTSPYAENFIGPIIGLKTYIKSEGGPNFGFYGELIHGNPERSKQFYVAGYTTLADGSYFPKRYCYITGVTRLDGALDVGGNPPSPPLPSDQRSPDTRNHPQAQPDNRGVITSPAASVPGGLRSREGGNPRGDSPAWTPLAVPKGQLSPVNVPQNLGGALPAFNEAPSPARGAPGDTSSSTTSDTPGNAAPPLGQNPGAGSGVGTGNSKAGGAGGVAVSDAHNQNFPNPGAQPTEGNFNEAKDPALPNIPLIPPLVRPVDTPTNLRTTPVSQTPPQPNYNNASNLCEIDPCIAGLQQQSQSNSDKLDKLGLANLGAQGLSLAEILKRLDKIDTKLGPQLGKAGISGFLADTFKGVGRIADFLQVDRMLNALTFITVLHNAYFLSSGLTQTLLSLVSNSLAVFGIKDSEGSPLEINRIVGQAFDSWAKSLLGVESVDGIKKAWAKYSRIYAAATNLLTSLTGILWGIQEVLEIIGENVNRIGNALKKWGVVGERAYKWMNEKMSKVGKFGKFDRALQGIGSATEVTDNLSEISENVLDSQELVGQLGTQKADLEKALNENPPKTQIQNQPLEDKNSQAILASISPRIDPVDEIKPES